jgi:hypothetical protein
MRQSRKIKQKIELTDEIRSWLENPGLDFILDDHVNREKLYRTYKAELFKMHFADPESLGTRPQLWWKYDRPGNRELLRGSYDALPNGPEFSYNGRPGIYIHDNVYESQFAFLKRHNLLTDHEKDLHLPLTEVDNYRDDPGKHDHLWIEKFGLQK